MTSATLTVSAQPTTTTSSSRPLSLLATIPETTAKTMDPPDKRNEAYASIFGRPQARTSTHSYDPYQVQYTQPTRNSYPTQTTYVVQNYVPTNNNTTTYQRASYYPPQTYQVYQPTYYYPHPPGVVSPLPSQEPLDAGLEHLITQGMTPAQAYQHNVYLNSPSAQPQPYYPERTVSPQSSSSSHASGLPLPAVEIDRGALADLTSDDGTTESELPWNRDTPSPSGSRQMHSASSSLSRRSYREVDNSYPTTHTPNSLQPSPPIHSGEQSPTSRNSADSTRTTPRSQHRRSIPVPDRGRSNSTPKARSMVDFGAMPPLPSSRHHSSLSKSSAVVTVARRSPIVYPALLSRVAEAFRARISLVERVKDGLAYQDAFDGREAVDKIAYIIKTTDRNLALLLGRALDAQKFFHDVTYDHRLRDSPYELYQFKSRIPSPFVSADEVTTPQSATGTPTSSVNSRPLFSPEYGSLSISSASSAVSSSAASQLSEATTLSPENHGHGRHQRGRANSVSSTDDMPLPSGVFTLLTDCYSPTCTRDSLCYSIACPRRLEQQARLNMKPQPGLRRSLSSESLGDYAHQEAGTLWIHSVPQEVVDSVSDLEKKRQEAINEVIYTERDFVRDMEYLRDVWIKPLQTSDIIPEARRTDFIEQVFWNIHEILAVNIKLREALNKRQKSYAVVETIGDIFLEVAPHFAPFVKYGSHQLYGKYEFEKEKASNPAFAQFVDEAERLPESRKLELNGYLTKPTTRLARYPLLLEVVLKYTTEDNPDKHQLVKVVQIVRGFLREVNEESGKTENRFNLLQLDQQLVFRNVEAVDLRLKDDNRELLYKGTLKRRGQNENGDLNVFLFDHALLMVKAKTKHEQFRVYRRPIPLELLVVSAQEDVPPPRPPTVRVKPLMKRNSFSKDKDKERPVVNIPVIRQDSKNGFGITFMHLGRKGYVITLWASTFVGRKKWLEAIAKQQDILRRRSMTFDTITLSEGFFHGVNKVNCAAPFNHGLRMAYGTDTGVYFSNVGERGRDPVHVLEIPDVMQVDILEDYDLLIVLSERSVMTFPLEGLDPRDPTAGLKRAKRISSHTSFFKAGTCLGRTLVCVVKASALSSTIKTLEPIDQNVRGKNKPTFRKLLQGGNDTLRVFKEFYIPTESSSIHFLKTKLCVGCTKGFEIVDLESLDTQGLLDPGDKSLDFVQRRENVRPIAIYRIENEFLLCYDEFAFYVNKSGERARPNWIVYWEGQPTAFALCYPFVLAFEPTFVEVRHIDTGTLIQVIPGNGLRCLFADTPPSTTNSAAGFYARNPHLRSLYATMPYGRQSYHQPPYGVPPPPLSPYGMPMHLPPTSSRASYYPHAGQPSPVQPYTRDEIVLVSEDRVMSVRLAPPPSTPSMSYASSSAHSHSDSLSSFDSTLRPLSTTESTLVGP